MELHHRTHVTKKRKLFLRGAKEPWVDWTAIRDHCKYDVAESVANYHVLLCVEAGYMKRETSGGKYVVDPIRYRLTWGGHEYLDERAAFLDD